MALTQKQEKFCRNIVSGMSNKDAYNNAYNSKSDNAAWIESTKLLKREDIQKYISDLRKPIEIEIQSNQFNARQKQIDFINDRINICKEKGDEQSIIRYTDMLNKIHGIYKEEIDKSEQKTNISNVSTDTLLKLVSSE